MIPFGGVRDRLRHGPVAGTAVAARPTGPVALPLRAATAVSVGAVAAVLVIALAAPAVWERWPWLPFAVGLLAGLPHGALDHLVPWWTGAARHGLRRTGAFLLAYLALAVLTFATARLWPTPALVLLLLGSAVHFGVGETAVADRRGAGRVTRLPRWPGFGAATVVLPFVAWPATVRPVLDVLAPGSSSLLLDPTVLRVAAVATGVAIAVAVAACLCARRPGQLAELVLLVALFVVVPPLPAFGVYFGAWHGLRHLARIVAVAPANTADLARGRLARPVARVAAHAALPTGAVLAALAVLLAVPGAFGHAVAGVVPAGLALVLALTVPHMIVVALLDRRQPADALPASR